MSKEVIYRPAYTNFTEYFGKSSKAKPSTGKMGYDCFEIAVVFVCLFHCCCCWWWWWWWWW